MRYVIETDRLEHNVEVLRRELSELPLIAGASAQGSIHSSFRRF